jgi:hypothetical protein
MDRRRATQALGSLTGIWYGIVILAIAVATGAPSPATAQTLSLQVNTPSITLAPTLTDYAQDFVERTGSAGIQLSVRTSTRFVMSILMRCPDAAPRIALSDLLVRTPTPAGPGGAALSSYTPVSATNISLWSGLRSVAQFQTVSTDIRIRNLGNYDDSPFPGTTSYTNTLVFTVVAQ